MTQFEKAIKYVRKNATWTDAELQAARDKTYRYHYGIQQADPSIADDICDLMEEYGEDHDLPEGWWLEYGDEDDVFNKL